MTAKYFVCVDQAGEILYRNAAEIIARNTDAFIAGHPAPYAVLAQTDNPDDATRFVELMRQQA